MNTLISLVHHKLEGVLQVVLQSWNHRDQINAAEVIWALKVSFSGYSFSSCDGTVATFQEIFPGDISKYCTKSKAELSYIISDGLELYFRGGTGKTNSQSKVYFKFQFDETGNAQGNKQCEVLIKRLSKIKNITCTYMQRHTMTEIVNQSRSTALERSVKILLGGGRGRGRLNRFYVTKTLALCSAIVYTRQLSSSREGSLTHQCNI